MEKSREQKRTLEDRSLAVRRTLPVEEAKEKSREIFQKVTAHPWYIEQILFSAMQVMTEKSGQEN